MLPQDSFDGTKNSMQDQKPRVSVIIPMFNEAVYIARCLQSLLVQDIPPEQIELLVLDGGSTDGSEEVVRGLMKRHQQICLLENKRKIASSAFNVGIQQSRGAILLILGAHSVVPKGFIRMNLKCLDDLPEVSCVGGQFRPIADQQSQQALGLILNSRFGMGTAFRCSQKAQFVETVGYGAYRREVFDRVGLFNEEMICNQDDEFNYRLFKSGGKLYFNPNIISYYFSKLSFKRFVVRYFQYGLWKVKVFQLHPQLLRLRHLVPPLFVLSIVLLPIGQFSKLTLYTFAIVWGSYFIANLLFSLRICSRAGLRYMFLVPFAFLALHLSYGLGELTGLFVFRKEFLRNKQVA